MHSVFDNLNLTFEFDNFEFDNFEFDKFELRTKSSLSKK